MGEESEKELDGPRVDFWQGGGLEAEALGREVLLTVEADVFHLVVVYRGLGRARYEMHAAFGRIFV